MMILFEDDINRLIEIQAYINSNLEKDLKAGSIAKKFNLETHTLCRHFSHHFEMPLHQYVVQVRLAKAYELLRNRFKSVSEVATIVGYRDKSTFSSAFSARYLISPKELFKKGPEQ